MARIAWVGLSFILIFLAAAFGETGFSYAGASDVTIPIRSTTNSQLIDTTSGFHRAMVFLYCAQEFGWTGVSQTCADHTTNTSLASFQNKIDTGFSVYNAPVLNFMNPVLAAKV